MIQLNQRKMERYLSELYKDEVEITMISELGKGDYDRPAKLKGFGYGIPYLIRFSVRGEEKRVVLETVKPSQYGHEHFSDRAQLLLWQNSAFNKLPNHVRSIDVGAFTKESIMKSLGDCEELFILTEMADGEPYHRDLDRISETWRLQDIDLERCLALSDYLVSIHAMRDAPTNLYRRRIRELLGHGECIMGIVDGYPEVTDFIGEKELIRLEKLCLDWRWRLKGKIHRCSQVHGDFHPWNILFREDAQFTVLDRSRGEWGEPADDTTALTINYIFYSVRRSGRLEGPFEKLFTLFWENYLDKTGDEEMLSVVQPFYAWRGLVIASPTWYPSLSVETRKILLSFIKNVLTSEKFEVDKVNTYLKETMP